MADFYMRTALALDKVNSKKSSIKAAASTHSKDDTKRVLALLVNSLAFRQPLQSIIQSSQLRRLEAKVFSQFDRKSRVGGHGDDDDGDGDHDHDDEVEGNRRGRKKSQSAATKRSSKTSDDKQSRSDRAWNGVKDLPSSSSLILVLVHDLLLSSRGIQASKNWPPKLAVERHRARLHSELVRVQIKMGKSSFQELKAGNEVVEAGQGGRSHNQIVGSIPRWVRVNELKSDLESVKRWFQEKGWKLVDGEGDGPCFLIESRSFATSKHVPNLLAFPPKSTSEILSTDLYKKGEIVLQDLASCIPAQVLNPFKWETTNPIQAHKDGGSQVSKNPKKRKRSGEKQGGEKEEEKEEFQAVDATSAPGNKTSHLSALMKGRSKITAFERSEKRYKTLRSLLSRSGALRTRQGTTSKDGMEGATLGNVETVLLDFLKTEPEDPRWAKVKYMLVDPSCSGSGIVNRLDYLKEDDEDDVDDVSDDHADEDDVNEEDKEGGGVEQGDDPNLQSTRSKPERRKRLERLSNFQVKMLRHAMRFPNLGRLVYSTCSVHPEENEGVVIRILKSPEALERGWVLAGREEVLPDWKVRGLKEFCQGDDVLADSVIRCIPGGNPCVKYEGVGGEGGEGDGRLRIHPHTEASNGFFVACFKRKTSQEEGDDTDRGEQGRTEGSGKVNPDESDEEERERRERRRREMNRKKNQAKKRREKERKVAIQSDPTSGAHPTPP